MATGIPTTQVQIARKRDDKRVIEGSECGYCGEDDGHIVTYYDVLAQDRTCIACGKTY